jgi:NADPH:quinone reductase-like Zn-dependent oxidoreductase
LALIDVPTVAPTGREVQIHVEWTASTPLDLHQNDGGLLLTHPLVLGDGIAGTVTAVGPDVKNLAVGDKVFGFAFRENKQKAYQDFATVPETALGKIPAGFSMQKAVTLPNNTVTVFHAVTKDLGLPLAWPRPDSVSVASNPHGNTPILIWGGASSCGQYALQILSHWGYTNLLTTASKKHHAYLHSLGARRTFDYHDADVAAQILKAEADYSNSNSNSNRTITGPAVPYVLDCIASQQGSLARIAEFAQAGTIVAALLPVIVRDATDDVAPEYSMDTQAAVDWADGVEARGVRTHFYDEVSCVRCMF